MSETRDFLEQQFQAEPQTDRPETENIINEGNGEQVGGAANPEVDPYLEAPNTFKKEYAEAFKSLTPEMRKYLHERESENVKGFSRLNNELRERKWMDDIFNSRQERLSKIGVNNAREWVEYLAKIDDAFATDPQNTLNALAQSFGIAGQNTTPENNISPEFQALQQRLNGVEQMLQNRQMQEAQTMLSKFVEAKDESGAPVHPHYEAVKDTMSMLIRNGMALDLESAYEQAVWMNKDVRAQMVKAQAEAELKAKAEEAAKAKQAGFNPKGKPSGVAEPELSTREFLEKQFGILGES